MRKLPLFLLFLFSLPTFCFAEELRLEGLMYDETNPKGSIAIVNGEPVHLGMRFQGYLVKEMSPSSVTVYDLETEEKTVLRVKAPKKEKKTASVQNAEQLEGEVKARKENFFEKLRNAPARMVNRGVELKVLYDIAIINNACVNYYNMMGFFPGHIKQLTNAGLIKKDYSEGKVYQYKLYFEPVQHADRFGFHADPIEPNSGLHSFFVSEDAIIRASKNGPANRNSPAHEYPGLPKQ